MDSGDDISQWPQRSEAAKRLGISVTTLRRYEGKLITPVVDERGENRFNPKDLDALARQLRKRKERRVVKRSGDAPRKSAPAKGPPEPRVSGETTKRAFEMFEKSVPLSRVVIDLEEASETVEWLHERWLTLSGRKPESPPPARTAKPMTRAEWFAAHQVDVTKNGVSPAQVRALPMHLRDQGDEELLRLEEKIDAEKRAWEAAQDGARKG
jgi:DNA-binding transcriptional MerR regulator